MLFLRYMVQWFYQLWTIAIMIDSYFEIEYDNDETRVYRGVTIHRNRQIKTGNKGCYYVKDSLRTSIEDAKEYIDGMLEACGIEFFTTRKNPLIIED